MRRGVLRLRIDHALQGLDTFRELPGIEGREAEVRQRADVIGFICEVAPVLRLREVELAAAKMDVAEREIGQRMVWPSGKQLLQEIPGLIGAPDFLERRGGHHPRGRFIVRARNGCSIEKCSKLDKRFVEAALFEERLAKGVAYVGVIGDRGAQVLDRLAASPNPQE